MKKTIFALQACACAFALTTIAFSAHAQTWPDKTIKIIAPSAPGGGFDLTARMLAEKLGPALGVSVVVENKTGAGTRLGTDLAAQDRTELYRDQIARADTLYDQGLAGVPMLVHGRRSVAAAGAMYREILREIERGGYGARRRRSVVSRPRKARLVARAFVRPSRWS